MLGSKASVWNDRSAHLKYFSIVQFNYGKQSPRTTQLFDCVFFHSSLIRIALFMWSLTDRLFIVAFTSSKKHFVPFLISATSAFQKDSCTHFFFCAPSVSSVGVVTTGEWAGP
ncbi:hypothetical protein TSMEX_005609 [Taenia solium]|eukprot:TsM_000293700 transcript=TsM_000293700 gene=TsM_000293700